MEKVNHPRHYNQHPSGVECIDIIRNYVCDIANAIKYLWRAGLKGEEGMAPVDKEIEDLRKAIWHIRDFIENYKYLSCQVCVTRESHVVRLADGRIIHIQDIACHYTDDIAVALAMLWGNGVIAGGKVVTIDLWLPALNTAINAINAHIKHLQR